MQGTQPSSVVTAQFERCVGSLALDVDGREATLWLVVLASVTLDVTTTYLGLAAGLKEGNPAMRWAIEEGGFAALGVTKVIVLAVAGLFREVRPRHGPTIALGLAVPWVLAVLVNAVVLLTV